jgi:hypothetical protein
LKQLSLHPRRWGALATLLLALLAGFAVPAAAESARHAPKVVREGNGWMQESDGALGNVKLVQVMRFIGSVRVLPGRGKGSYLLRLHSAESDEAAARRQFSTFHFIAGSDGNQDILHPLGEVDLKLRAELVLELPAHAEVLHVETLAGKITIQGRVHRLELHTHGGDIEVDDADELQAITSGGSVQVNHRVGNAFIHTDGGDIRVEAAVGDLQIASMAGSIGLKAITRARIESGGGNIEIMRCLGELAVRTAGGNINLGEMGGPVTIESGGGNIRVGVAHGMVAINSTMGDIELWKLAQGVRAHTGMGRITAEFIAVHGALLPSELLTAMGDIVIFFGGDTSGYLRAVTGVSPTHHVISDFPELHISNGLAQYGPHSILMEGSIHGGGPGIEARTMVGQIEVHPAH